MQFSNILVTLLAPTIILAIPQPIEWSTPIPVNESEIPASTHASTIESRSNGWAIYFWTGSWYCGGTRLAYTGHGADEKCYSIATSNIHSASGGSDSLGGPRLCAYAGKNCKSNTPWITRKGATENSGCQFACAGRCESGLQLQSWKVTNGNC